MSVFDRRELLQSITGEQKNTLRTIGFSSELLRLHLDDDQLWEFAKKTAQRLIMILHPDHKDVEEQAANMAIRQAFESLKDKNVFLRDLEDLKSEINKIRSSENEQKRSVHYSENLVKEAQRKEQEAVNNQKALSKSLGKLRQRLVATAGIEMVNIRNSQNKERQPLQQVRMIRQSKQAITLHISVQAWEGTLAHPAELDQILDKYRRDRERERRRIQKGNQTRKIKGNKTVSLNGERMSLYIGEAHQRLVKGGFASRDLLEMVDEATKQPLPTLNWDLMCAVDKYGIARGNQHKRKRVDSRLAQEASSFEPKTFQKAYRQSFEQVIAFLKPRFNRVSEICIRPEIIDLSGGVIDEAVVVGSAFLDDQTISTRTVPGLFDLGYFPDDLERKYLCEGALIATTSSIAIGLTGSSSKDRAEKLPNLLAKSIASKKMVSSYLLIEFL